MPALREREAPRTGFRGFALEPFELFRGTGRVLHGFGRSGRYHENLGQLVKHGHSVGPTAFQAGWQFALDDPVVALLFQFEREFLAAGSHDAAVHQHVDEVGHDVVQQPLVMRDDELGVVRRASACSRRCDTTLSASMSRPESVSSRMASFGSSTAIWKISLRFFSPPEKPSLTERLSKSSVQLAAASSSPSRA